MHTHLSFLLIVFFVAVSLATYGVDISDPISKSGFECLKGRGYSFLIQRAFRSTGSVDPQAPSNMKNAKSAGFKYIDAYIFPCPKCSSSAAAQLTKTVDFLKENGVSYGMLWFDLEGAKYWHTDKAKNLRFTHDFFNACDAKGIKCGMYTTKVQWQEIMGLSTTGFGGRQLWYAHYDNKPSFSDWKPFGGWKSPAIKQFQGDTHECGLPIDKDWYP